MSFEFTPESRPFPRWWGPYTPSKGNRSGFRFHRGKLGTWVGDAFWTVRRSRGVELLEQVVRQHWGGGRVLLLPNGVVVKPLQEEEQRGVRECIGRIKGDVVLVTPDGEEFPLRNPAGLRPGGAWHGPRSTGLSCVLQADGSLKCAWYHPDGFDTITQTMKLTPPNTALAKTFRAVRGIHAGSVRVTANGAIITSWQHHGEWRCHYLGHLDASQWPHLEEWIEPRTGVAREGNAPDVPANAQPTVASARTEDDDSDNGEESSIDYPLDPTEALFEDWFAPPEIEEEEEEEEETEEAEEETEEDAETEAEDIDTVDVGDAGLHQATFSEQHKLLSCIDSHGGDLAKAPATSQRQYATAQVKRQPTPTRLWNWVVSKLKGQS